MDADDKPKARFFVAIHGIGDQYRYATIQSVARQVTRFCEHPIGWPLGYFHLNQDMTEPRQYVPPPPDVRKMGRVLFGEIFWADIHRAAGATGDTIEEQKAWARTVVDRLRALDETGSGPRVQSKIEKVRASFTTLENVEWQSPSNYIDYRKTAAVMEEIIETLAALENLTTVADKAGWFHFNLNTILTDFIGTVQVVAEFNDYREQIIERFRSVMTGLLDNAPETDEIHLIAHSEGTVVTLKVLMEVFGGQTKWEDMRWASKIKGLMTFGSPLNKHIVMWPDLWKTSPGGGFPNLRPSQANLKELRQPIRWYNYYDKGDPVGFDLEITRKWLHENHWITEDKKSGVFDFDETNDCGFVRYPLPGEAHNDYWNDPTVFDHYFEHAVVAGGGKKPPKPPTVISSFIISWTAPFIICLGLLGAGVYVLYKSVHAFTDPTERTIEVAQNACGLTAMLAGITVLSRIPRLVKFGIWHLAAAGFFAAGGCGFLMLTESLRKLINGSFGYPDAHSCAAIIVAVAIGLVSSGISKIFPEWGMRPLILLASAAVANVAGWAIWGQMVAISTAVAAGKSISPAHISLWPLVLAGLAFYFLWTLAALLFDLSFVWYRYIRANAARGTMDRIRTEYDQARAKGAVSLLY